jgi:hypothetical protein
MMTTFISGMFGVMISFCISEQAWWNISHPAESWKITTSEWTQEQWDENNLSVWYITHPGGNDNGLHDGQDSRSGDAIERRD